MRRVIYVSGTRADYGLMRATLRAIGEVCDLSLVVTGMHLDSAYGRTANEITADEHRISGRVRVPLDRNDGAEAGANLGLMITAFSEIFARERAEIVLLLGDRGEMLAGAIAAAHLGIVVAHLHGGERSGTLDESVRHAVTKLAHIHLPATEGSARRIVKMGENPHHVHVVGAPGLVGLASGRRSSRDELARIFGFNADAPLALLLLHPEAPDPAEAAEQVAIAIDALSDCGAQTIALLPNSDAGSAGIRDRLKGAAAGDNLVVETHLSRDRFVDVMANCDVMIGNSSAGIIEAATFGTPVVNIGSRQRLRERNTNVIDVSFDRPAIAAALSGALSRGRGPAANVYGDGLTDRRVADLLGDYELGPDLLRKINAY